jgi:hypothetical protein
MRQLKLTVPTYYGAANSKQNVIGGNDFEAPNVSILIHEAEGVRIVVGTHDFSDLEKPDIQIERRPKGWAIFLHPVGGGDASGYVYFLDDGRSFLLQEDYATSGAIEVLCGEEPPEIDDLDLPEPHTYGRQAMKGLNQRSCARCRQISAYVDDWYGDLCPECADQTDGEWVCRACGRRGSFEAMGGNGGADPICCASPCHRTNADGPTKQ